MIAVQGGRRLEEIVKSIGNLKFICIKNAKYLFNWKNIRIFGA